MSDPRTSTSGAPAAGHPALLRTPGLGESQREILVRLKRSGTATLAEVGAEMALATETLREHLNALAARGLVERAGHRREGPGRPEILYRLAPAGEALFPQREGHLLRELAAFLRDEGRDDLLRSFFQRRVERRRRQAMRRLEGLSGRERLEEVAAILSEEGFMAEVVDDAGAAPRPRLQLCNCPFRELVAVSELPCEAEVAYVEELLGRNLQRTSYMPAGDHACAYVPGDSADG